MKNEDKDLLPLFVLIFVFVAVAVFITCYIHTRDVRQFDEYDRIVDSLRSELTESRNVNTELAERLADSQRRINDVESELQATTERLRESNDRLSRVSGIIDGASGTAGNAADLITDSRQQLRGIIIQLDEIRKAISY